MKKKLVFFWYVDVDHSSNPIYRLHMNELCRYNDIFDEALFIMSLKQDDDAHRSMATGLASELLMGGYNDSRFIFEENTGFRESKAFHEHVHSAIETGESSLIFFGHSKGLSNVFNDSLIAWICSMYYFSLERVSDAIDAMVNRRKVAYGFPAVLYTGGSEAGIFYPINGFYYMGAMFWLNASLAHMAIKIQLGDDDYELADRYYSEDYIGNVFRKTECSSYCDVAMWDYAFDATYGFHEAINSQFFDYINDDNLKNDFWNYVNEIKSEVGLQ